MFPDGWKSRYLASLVKDIFHTGIDDIQRTQIMKKRVHEWEKSKTIEDAGDDEKELIHEDLHFIFEKDQYTGEVKDGLKHGKGKMIYKLNNSIYEGEWKDDKRHGKGILKQGDHVIYDGEWENDMMHGKGKYKTLHGTDNNRIKTTDGTMFEEGWKHTGFWKKNKRHGIGKTRYKNGDLYTGEWKNGKRNGKGIFRQKGKADIDGIWKNDKLEK